jgi:hypothetical protein
MAKKIVNSGQHSHLLIAPTAIFLAIVTESVKKISKKYK